MVIAAKLGHSMAQNVNYIATAQIFPAIYTGTAFGVCNIFAKLVSISSPILAEMQEPIPMTIYAVCSGIGGIIGLFFI